METNRTRRRGDRKDAYLLRDLDAMHKFIPYLLPNRCDNEAVMSELIDLTAVNEYVAKKNASNPAFRYTLFHVLCAAIAKTVTLRPRLNCFVAGHRAQARQDGRHDRRNGNVDKNAALSSSNRGRHSDVAGLSRLGSDMAYKG